MTEFETQALRTLDEVTRIFGAPLVQAVVNDVLGQGGGMIIEDVSSFVATIVRATLEVLDESTVKGRVAAAYAAADAVVDAAIDARFRDTRPDKG